MGLAMPRASVVMMCGLPASGKTTTAGHLHSYAGGALIRSCDVYADLGIRLPDWVARTRGFTIDVHEYGADLTLVHCRCDDPNEVARRFARRRGRENVPEHEASDRSVFRDIERRWEDPHADVSMGGGPAPIITVETSREPGIIGVSDRAQGPSRRCRVGSRRRRCDLDDVATDAA